MTRIYIDKPDAIGFEDEADGTAWLKAELERDGTGVWFDSDGAITLSPAHTRLLAAKLAGWAGTDEENQP